MITVAQRRALIVAVGLLAPCCHDDSDPEGLGGGTAWWNQPAPFVVAATLPADGASAVDLCAPIRVTFSRDANGVTVDGTTFTVTAGAPVSGTVTYDVGTRTATFSPAALLAASTVHTVTLAGGILSAAGEPLAPRTLTFTTVGPFARVSANPAPGSTGAPINTNISITLNKAVNAASLQASDFVVTGPSVATASYTAATRTITLTTSGNLPADTDITVSVALFGFVFDTCGEVLQNVNLQFTFRTGFTGDTTPPTFAGASLASAPNALRVVVTWPAATDNVTPQGSIFYRVYRVGFGLYATTAAGALSFTDTGVSPATGYSYIVHAVDGVGNEDTNSVTVSVTTPARRTWTSVYGNIIAGGGYGCTGCHSGGNLNLSSQATAYSNLVNFVGTCGTRVSPGNGSGSSLYLKVSLSPPPCGSRMPPTGSGLTAAQLDEILDWIDEGALNN